MVASVSCIYGLGSADAYKAMMVPLTVGQEVNRNKMLAKFVDIQYERNDIVLERGRFRVRGDCVEIYPSYEEFAVRIEFWGDEIEQITHKSRNGSQRNDGLLRGVVDSEPLMRYNRHTCGGGIAFSSR